MAVGVRATLSVSLIALLTGAAVAGESPRFKIDEAMAAEFAPGTATVDEANLLYSADRTLGASATEDLDFSGVLSTPLGLSIAAAEITIILVQAAAGNVNNVEFGPTASVGFLGPFKDLSDRQAIKPGEFALFVSRSGWPVTAATGDKWTFTNSGGTTGVTYTIHVIGRTVAA